MEFKITRFVDITFIAKNMDQTAAFYEKVGLKKLPTESPKEFAIGDQKFAVYRELPPDYPVPSPNTVYVGVIVDDLEAFCRHLDAQGIAYHGPQESHLGENSVHLTDPDGNHLEVHQEKR